MLQQKNEQKQPNKIGKREMGKWCSKINEREVYLSWTNKKKEYGEEENFFLKKKGRMNSKKKVNLCKFGKLRNWETEKFTKQREQRKKEEG